VQWDLTALTVARDTGAVTVQLDFSSDVISPVTGITTAMVGFVDFDVDQDPRTGNVAIADESSRDGGSTGIGADYLLFLGTYAADSSVEVVDSLPNPTGRVKVGVRRTPRNDSHPKAAPRKRRRVPERGRSRWAHRFG
jgi:hypothetical protein